MAKILVVAELAQGVLQPTAAEILTRARDLGDVAAIALGTGAKAAADVLGKHGAKTVYVNEDKAFDEYLAEPAADAIEQAHKQDAADLILFGFTSDSRDGPGRLGARLGCGLIANASYAAAAGGGVVATVPYFGRSQSAWMR